LSNCGFHSDSFPCLERLVFHGIIGSGNRPLDFILSDFGTLNFLACAIDLRFQFNNTIADPMPTVCHVLDDIFAGTIELVKVPRRLRMPKLESLTLTGLTLDRVEFVFSVFNMPNISTLILNNIGEIFCTWKSLSFLLLFFSSYLQMRKICLWIIIVPYGMVLVT
jgi:hypothetical protein